MVAVIDWLTVGRRKDQRSAGQTGGVSLTDDASRRERFEALVADAYAPLLRFLRRRTDAATADDVLGDTLLVLWRRFDDVPADAPLAWCYGVARGCLANAVRGQARQLRLLHRLAAEPDPTAATPSDDAELDAALARLPTGDREVLRLWAWEQLPSREIAVALGISANAASIRRHRATRRLRDELTARKTTGPGGHPGSRQGREAPR